MTFFFIGAVLGLLIGAAIGWFAYRKKIKMAAAPAPEGGRVRPMSGGPSAPPPPPPSPPPPPPNDGKPM